MFEYQTEKANLRLQNVDDTPCSKVKKFEKKKLYTRLYNSCTYFQSRVGIAVIMRLGYYLNSVIPTTKVNNVVRHSPFRKHNTQTSCLLLGPSSQVIRSIIRTGFGLRLYLPGGAPRSSYTHRPKCSADGHSQGRRFPADIIILRAVVITVAAAVGRVWLGPRTKFNGHRRRWFISPLYVIAV